VTVHILVYSAYSSRQAFKNHKIVDIFEEPGTADLTANVDFTYLKESLADSGTPCAASWPS
jgi:NADH dehydrogenase [ubiquinone] 1 alpha subcomplex assembly factor 7